MVLPKTGAQARLMKHAPYAVLVHCHLLQLACLQAANSTTEIKHVYTTVTTLWNYFHFSPKRAKSLKEIQHVLNLPEMKVIKPSDTRWLAHERCVKAVKVSYTALVVTLTVATRISMHLKLWDYTRLYPSSPPLQPFIYWITFYH